MKLNAIFFFFLFFFSSTRSREKGVGENHFVFAHFHTLIPLNQIYLKGKEEKKKAERREKKEREDEEERLRPFMTWVSQKGERTF